MKHILKKISGTSKIKSLLAEFSKKTDGLAAVEFALIAPLLVLIFLGTVETSYAISVDRKISRTASAVADLIAQGNGQSEAIVKELMTISNKIMAPYDLVPCIVVTSIKIESGVASVYRSYDNSSGVSPAPTSSCTNTGDPNDMARRARAEGSVFPVPAAIKIDGTELVATEVEADHSPIVGFFGYADGKVSKDSAAINLGDMILLRPRLNGDVLN